MGIVPAWCFFMKHSWGRCHWKRYHNISFLSSQPFSPSYFAIFPSHGVHVFVSVRLRLFSPWLSDSCGLLSLSHYLFPVFFSFLFLRLSICHFLSLFLRVSFFAWLCNFLSRRPFKKKKNLYSTQFHEKVKIERKCGVGTRDLWNELLKLVVVCFVLSRLRENFILFLIRRECNWNENLPFRFKDINRYKFVLYFALQFFFLTIICTYNEKHVQTIQTVCAKKSNSSVQSLIDACVHECIWTFTK